MNLSQLLAFLQPFAGVVEPLLLNIEQNNIQPELKKLIDGVSSPDLKLLLQSLDGAIDAFVQVEVKKLVP